jgi:uncharacterized membrane protein YedE/YeeE
MSEQTSWRLAAASLLSGTVFGGGLALAQITAPRKVLDFLDVSGAWDPSLLFVLGAAVLFSGANFHWILRRAAPLLDTRFHLPLGTRIDSPLLAGSALFGVGWGLAGYCPGPAIASLGFGNPEALWLLPAMVLGMALQRVQSRRRTSVSNTPCDA